MNSGGNRRIALDNSAGTQNQRRRTFARKTYRHFDGGETWLAMTSSAR